MPVVSSSHLPLPKWLRRAYAGSRETRRLKILLRNSNLNTVCEEARCPNITECFGRGTATFMILGDVCTRGCRFCSIKTGKPDFEQADIEKEADSVANAAKQLGLKYVVVTSVTRDDLEDQGAAAFCLTVKALRKKIPGVGVEVLIPDLRGSRTALETILSADPDVLNHNLETVPRLYRRVRPGAGYSRSLALLKHSLEFSSEIKTKTGIMLGLGEEKGEVLKLMSDARDCGVSFFTAGQYMQPSREHLKVERYITPEEFAEYEKEAAKLNFEHVAIGPLVRSSYRAEAALAAD